MTIRFSWAFSATLLCAGALLFSGVGCDGATLSCDSAYELAAGGSGRFCVEIGPKNAYAALDMGEVCSRSESNVPNDALCSTAGRIGICSEMSNEQGPNGEVISYTGYFYDDAGATVDDARALCESFHGTFTPS